mmetsp:Transcript_30891/g.27210  ORF Transcript_30891/g.27210 Transcript_30891/m.27210 type:complete len:178 (-) Transcript_30891:78-611(-)|eukprot:CAMPEP_0201581692 /NCGR_PEP_ID=MMETSP0190_2-20130828/73785_1 /ASSEMBLY_ACC=CAM_ASM_000263 /TAXON_ID=37353 /ORGANISM="Rosalina sp." /LENGTH=177 /DNA_ID=CAMNT_0048020223 /DNA_START=69 /DNA_END=602 /DNA_ORIENTATION=+
MAAIGKSIRNLLKRNNIAFGSSCSTFKNNFNCMGSTGIVVNKRYSGGDQNEEKDEQKGNHLLQQSVTDIFNNVNAMLEDDQKMGEIGAGVANTNQELTNVLDLIVGLINTTLPSEHNEVMQNELNQITEAIVNQDVGAQPYRMRIDDILDEMASQLVTDQFQSVTNNDVIHDENFQL